MFYLVLARKYGGSALKGMSGKPLFTSGHRAKTGAQLAESYQGLNNSKFQLQDI